MKGLVASAPRNGKWHIYITHLECARLEAA